MHGAGWTIARGAMGSSWSRCMQMRLVERFEIVNHLPEHGPDPGTAGTTLWLWSQGEVGVGRWRPPRWRAAPERHVALGCGRWPACSRTSARCRTASTRCRARMRWSTGRDAHPLGGESARSASSEVVFAYGAFGAGAPVIDDFTLTIRPGEKIRPGRRSGAAKSRPENLLLRFHDLRRRAAS